jgi:hypothetical protein
MTTPVIPPMKPKMISEKKKPIALGALRDLDRAWHGKTVDHARQYRQVHRVTGVEHFPLRADARVDQDVVRACQLQEQDVEQECRAADLFRHWPCAEQHAGDQVPDRYVRGNVDLLR